MYLFLGWKAIPEMLCNERIVCFVCQRQMWNLWSGDGLRRTQLTCRCRCSTAAHVCNRCLVNKRLHSYHNSQTFWENGLANDSELSPYGKGKAKFRGSCWNKAIGFHLTEIQEFQKVLNFQAEEECLHKLGKIVSILIVQLQSMCCVENWSFIINRHWVCHLPKQVFQYLVGSRCPEIKLMIHLQVMQFTSLEYLVK